MNCTETKDLMPYRALACLEADEQSALEQHLGSCERCSREARTQDELMTLLSEPPPGEPRLDRLWERVETGVSRDVAPPPSAEPPLVSIALVCAFCRDVLARADARYCASCLAPHHEECFKAHGRCSAYGCDETRTVRPAGDALPVARPRRGRLLLALPLLALGGAAAAVAAHRPPLRPPEVSVHASEEDLGAVVARIAREARTPIFIDPRVRERVTLDIERRAWPEALDLLAKRANCVIRPLGDGALVLEQPPRVTIQFTDANVRTVLQLIAAYTGKNIIISPEVHGDMTLDVHDVPWDDALRTLVATVGDYAVVMRGDLVMVRPRSTQAVSPWGSEDLAAPSWPRPLDPGAPGPRRVDLDVDGVDVRQVCARLAEASGRAIDVAPDVSGGVTIHAHDVSWRALLALACRGLDLRVSEDASGVQVETRSETTLQCTDANVRTLLHLLAAKAGKSLVLSPEVHGDVTVDVHSVPYDELMDAIVSTVGDYSCVFERSNLVRVMPRAGVLLRAEKPSYDYARGRRTVSFPGGRSVAISIQGTLEGTRALIEDRVFDTGDGLRDIQGRFLGVKLVLVMPGEVELEDLEDPNHPRVALKVQK
jgi:hypothetical protein